MPLREKINLKKIDSKTKFGQPSQNMVSNEGADILIADNSESNYQIYLKRDKVYSITNYTNPVVEDELLYKKSKTKTNKRIIAKFTQGDKNTVKPSSNDDRKFDWVSLLGFVLSIAAFGAVLLATILGGGVFLLGLALGILAIVFGSIGLGRVNKSFGALKGNGFSLAAIIIGGIFLAAITFFFIMLIIALGSP